MARFTRKVTFAEARRATKEQILDTHMGVQVALPGDWIVTKEDGERYPVRDDDFRKLYEADDDDARAMLGQTVTGGT